MQKFLSLLFLGFASLHYKVSTSVQVKPVSSNTKKERVT